MGHKRLHIQIIDDYLLEFLIWVVVLHIIFFICTFKIMTCTETSQRGRPNLQDNRGRDKTTTKSYKTELAELTYS